MKKLLLYFLFLPLGLFFFSPVYCQKDCPPFREFEILGDTGSRIAIKDSSEQNSLFFYTNGTMDLYVTLFDTSGTDSNSIKLTYQAYNDGDWIDSISQTFSTNSSKVGWKITAYPIDVSVKARVKAEGLVANKRLSYVIVDIQYCGVY